MVQEEEERFGKKFWESEQFSEEWKIAWGRRQEERAFRDFGEMEQCSRSENFEGECQMAMLSHRWWRCHVYAWDWVCWGVTLETLRIPRHTYPLRNRQVSRQSTQKPIRLAKLNSSLGGLCTGQECSGSRDLSLGMGVGQLGYWAQRVGHESGLVILVNLVENN